MDQISSNFQNQHPIITVKNVYPTFMIRATSYSFNNILLYPHRVTPQYPSLDMVNIGSLDSGVFRPTIIKNKIELFHSIFCEMHNSSFPQPFQPSSDYSLLDYSMRYRAAMQNLCTEFPNTKTSEALSTQELIWHLSEILYISPLGLTLSMKLLNWIQSHGKHTSRLLDIAINVEQQLSDIWNGIYSLIIHGRIDDCLNLLVLVSAQKEGWPVYGKKELNSITHLCNLLKVWPFRFENGSSNDLYQKWISWRELCREAVSSGKLQSIFEVELIGKLLCGIKESFEQIPLSACPRWIDMLVGLLLYCNPFVEAFTTELMNLVRYAYIYFNASGKIDRVLLNLFTSSLLDFFQLLCELEPSWCFAAHLADLFTFAGYHEMANPYNSTGEDEKLNLNEHIILGYATSLMSQRYHWIAGADYLMLACPLLGSSTLETYLERIGASSDQETSISVVAISDRYNLKSIRTSVCKIQTKLSLRSNEITQAINWCLMIGDDKLSKYLILKYIWHYMKEESMQNLLYSGKIGVGINLSEEFAFLQKFSEFKSLYATGDVWSSAKLLTNIIRSEVAPKEFWTTILFDTLPLLELEETLFSEDDTYELMRVLQELSASFSKDHLLFPLNLTKEEENEVIICRTFKLLRLRLTRNLSKLLFTDQ